MRRLAWLTVAAAALAGCSDKTPASIELGPPAGVLLGSEAVQLRAVAKNKGREALDTPVALATSPGDVAVITQEKGLRCTKSGDVEVVATAGPAMARAWFKCRPVAKVEVPSDLRLIIPNGPVRPAVALLDAAGNRYEDVVPTLTVVDASVASASGGAVTPVRVGTTTLVAAAGEARGSVLVTVVRKVKSEPLLLNDGSRIGYTLQQGRYEIEVRGKTAGSNRLGVTLKWVGGEADCQDQKEAQEIVSACTIANTGSVIIENPSLLGLGPTFDGFVNIYEVP